jgi:hypothetical protein
MTGSEMRNRTVAGLLAYCDWLRKGGYQTANAVEAWKVAIKRVFETVEPESYESISLDGIDLDDYVRRFRTLAADQYKAETISVYEKRIRNAIEAHDYYLEHDSPPTFRSAAPRSKQNGAAKPKAATKPKQSKPSGRRAETPAGELIPFPFPLRNGQMAELRLPARLDKTDADRLSAFLRTLQFEEQRQLPPKTGEQEDNKGLAA